MKENKKLERALSAANFLSSKGWKDENIKKHLSSILVELDQYSMSIVSYYKCFILNCLSNRI